MDRNDHFEDQIKQHFTHPALNQSPNFDVNGWQPNLESSWQSSSSTSNEGGLPLSKLTPSCSRCRSKKLKCRYPTLQSKSCYICLEKGLENECRRDMKVTRGKRRREDEAESKLLKGSMASVDRRVEIAALKRKLAELESMERGLGQPPSPAMSEDNVASKSTTSHLESETNKLKKDTEDVVLLLEELAQGKGTRKVKNESAIPRDIAQNKWQKGSALTERLELLQEAKRCSFASDETVVRELVSVFMYRVNHLVGHVIYAPGYQRAVEAFLDMSVEEIITSKIFIDPSCLATMMLVLCLGFEFHPLHPPSSHSPSPGFLAVQSIRQRSIDPTQSWYSIARRSLALEDSYHLASIPALQAACLFLIRGKESDGWMRMLHQVAICSARDFGLHNLGQSQGISPTQQEDFIRLECGVRIWNFLSMRDWSMSSNRNHICLIQPNQMTTRKPLNINDDDLEAGLQQGQPMSEWTMMSFVIVQAQLAELVRDSYAECRQKRSKIEGDQTTTNSSHRDMMREKLDCFLQDLPPYFKLHSQANVPGLIPVQRWLLHQQIFDLQLRLSRSDLISTEGRASCLQLAENIISHQANLRAICPVIDNLHINFFHLFGACMVVLLDLLYRSETQSNKWQVNRSRSRTRVIDTTKTFRGNAGYSRAIRVLEVMLNCEEEIHEEAHNKSGYSSSTSTQHRSRLSSIAQRIIKEVQPDSETSKSYNDHVTFAWPALLPHHSNIPDQTLLPVVGAWRHNSNDYNFSPGLQQVTGPTSNPPFQSVVAKSELNQLYHRPTSTSSLTPFQFDTIDHAQIFDWALGLGFDPFQGSQPSQISSSRIQREADLFHPIADAIVAPL